MFRISRKFCQIVERVIGRSKERVKIPSNPSGANFDQRSRLNNLRPNEEVVVVFLLLHASFTRWMKADAKEHGNKVASRYAMIRLADGQGAVQLPSCIIARCGNRMQ